MIDFAEMAMYEAREIQREKERTMPQIPPGPTSMKWYSEGYQQALADLLEALDNGGEDAAREWIRNNKLS